MSLFPDIPSPGEILDEGRELVEEGVDVAVDTGKRAIEGAGEFVLEKGASAIDCLASHNEWATGTLHAVVDGAELHCDQCPTPGTLIVISARRPVLAGGRAAATTDRVVGENIAPFAGTCEVTKQPCAPVFTADWVPAARGLRSSSPLLPDNALLVCEKTGIIEITRGQTSVVVTSEGPPLAPPGVDLRANVRIAQLLSSLPMDARLAWFFVMVRPGGPWDYKRKSRRYEDFGNFNYGATGHALGIPRQVLRRAAGAAQEWTKTSEPEYGHPYDVCGDNSFGDDPKDQEMIDAGIRHEGGHP